MSHIIDIFGNAVSAMRKSYTIQNILDNVNNTYTVTVNEINNTSLFSELKENEVITISETIGFNGDYRITNIDYNNKTFDISLTSGITIGVLGSITKNAPYFIPDYIVGLNEEITTKNLTAITQWQKFPLFYLSTDFEEKVLQGGIKEINKLVIYIINTTEYAKNVEWRHQSTFPYLRELEQLFFNKLESENCIQYGREYERKEIFYGKPNPNMANEIVDAIKLTINVKF